MNISRYSLERLGLIDGIKAALTFQGLRLKDIADRAGVAPSTVSVFLLGRSNPAVQAEIEKALGLTWDEITRASGKA